MAKKRSSKTAAKRRRRPKQARSQALVDAILIATAQLLRDHGPEEVTTNRIAERAGVSIGSLYQYFPNKRALYTAVAQQHVERLEREVASLVVRFADAEVSHFVRLAVEGMFTLVRVDAPLHAALQRVSLWGMTSGVISDFRVRIEGQLGLLLGRRAAEFPAEIDDPALAAKVAVRALAGILDASILEDPEVVHDPAFVEETTRLLESRLGVRS